MEKGSAKKMVKLLDKVLKIQVNSTSCILAYEPKTPATLDRYKKIKKWKMLEI